MLRRMARRALLPLLLLATTMLGGCYLGPPPGYYGYGGYPAYVGPPVGVVVGGGYWHGGRYWR